MEDWLEGMLFVLFMAALGAFLVLLFWAAVHFILWMPITGVPWVLVRAGCAIGAITGAGHLMTNS